MMSSVESDRASISEHALAVLQKEALLPICNACGTQYSMPQLQDVCTLCLDPRQYVPSTGQEWTSLAQLGQTRTISFIQDIQDSRIFSIQTEPGFGINQTPFLIVTAKGSYIWDCAATITPGLIVGIGERCKEEGRELRGMAISHPHFFATSLTWSRALRVPLYLCEADKEWYQRKGDITPSDQIVWWTDEAVLGEGVKVIQCGGHFPGSCILYWDRLQEPPPDPLPTKPTPVSGIIFTADTIMVQPTQHNFTFIWSAPNMIPLGPRGTIKILQKVEHLPFAQATSTWPNRFIRENAKGVLQQSVKDHLRAMGWIKVGDGFCPLEEPGVGGVISL